MVHDSDGFSRGQATPGGDLKILVSVLALPIPAIKFRMWSGRCRVEQAESTDVHKLLSILKVPRWEGAALLRIKVHTQWATSEMFRRLGSLVLSKRVRNILISNSSCTCLSNSHPEILNLGSS